MIWRTRDGEFDLSARGLVIGVLNITVDSFSDGGKFLAVDDAVAHARSMATEGADIIDIGGESTRPGAEPVAEAVELERIMPVVERLAGRISCAISVDTSKAAVARAALERGASIVNDVTGLRDPEMMKVVRESGAGIIIMHMKGTPRDMQTGPEYSDVVSEVHEFFRQQFKTAITFGIEPQRVVFDPGIGFGKTVEHNLLLLRHIEELRYAGRPVAIGVSRKSFLEKVLGARQIEERLMPTVALTSLCRALGANIFRVHDVQPNVQALRITEAVLK